MYSGVSLVVGMLSLADIYIMEYIGEKVNTPWSICASHFWGWLGMSSHVDVLDLIGTLQLNKAPRVH